MRSPSDMDILVIDLTNRCFLRCSNCTRDIAHQTETKEMTPETFRKALASLKPWWKPGKVIGLIGGEPTLNKHFAEICKIFREEFNPGVTTHGREPIRDMNAFATERLFDRSNGKGLWTSFGPKFREHYEDVMDTFSHWNSNDHSEGGKHQASLIDAREMCDALGIPWSEWPKYRDNCWLQNKWSAAITPTGKAYFCERAAHLDMIYNEGKKGWDIEKEPGWWRRTPDQFGDQLEICEMCSMALPGPSQVDNLDRDIIGQQHRIRLEMVGSPAIKGGRFESFDPAVHCERRTIDRKDNYVAESGRRVAVDNIFVVPKKVSCVVTCVGRAKHLQETVKHNLAQVDDLIIVTSRDDSETQSVYDEVRDLHLGSLHICQTDFGYKEFAAFNKGSLINEGISGLELICGPCDWVILTDADVFLNPNLKEFLSKTAINPGCLYGAQRVRKDSDEYIDREPNGFFQLFNRNAHAIRDRWPKVMCENFCSAGGIDSWFMQRYPPGKRIMLPDLPVTHIEHGEFGSGWNGSKNGKPRWVQVGMLTGRGMHWIDKKELPGNARLKLTDTKFGQTIELPLIPGRNACPPEILRGNGRGGFEFLGKDIGECHIHVALWEDASANAH